MCYFNYQNEIENDFAPSSIKDISDHNSLMDYLLTISKILNKPARLTNEMQQDDILINVIEVLVSLKFRQFKIREKY